MKQPSKKPQRVSLRGSLVFGRKVHYESVGTACRLAGEKLPDDCQVVALWRDTLAAGKEPALWKPSEKARLAPLAPLLLHLRIALAVRRLRKDMRRWPLRGGLVAVEGWGVCRESVLNAPGALVVISGSRHANGKESIDVNCALHDVSRRAHGDISDGISFGAVAVRVVDGKRLDGLVVWDGNRGAVELYSLTTKLHAGDDDHARRRARRALLRAARRLLREARRLLAERQAQQEDGHGAAKPTTQAE